VLGKPVASDLREGRLTLPLIYLRDDGDAKHGEMIRMLLDDRGFDRVPLADIVLEVKRRGALDRTRRLALSYCESALKALEDFPDSPARRSLLQICGFITSRTS
jgi:octaprenyl-diphosphate synthase